MLEEDNELSQESLGMNKSSVPQEDQVLIRQTLDGQSTAFGDLVRKYQNRLYNGMVQMLRNEAGLSLLPALRSTALHSLTRLRRG